MRDLSNPFRLALAALLLVLTLSAAPAQSLTGVALVIGQSKYEHVTPLANPASDAREMAKLLTDLGFDTRAVTDRDTAQLARDLERFAEDAAEADVALLYYAGHGIEAGGENWLLPVDADESSLDAAAETLVPLSELLDALKQSVPLTIVLLDACRTSPFPEGTVIRAAAGATPDPVAPGGLTAVRGATALNAPKPADDNLGMVIGFAAEPGAPALDGAAGENSPYARALLRHLSAMQGAEFGQVLRMVTEEVYLATGAQQRPWVNESLRRLVYFGIAPDEPEGVDKTITGERRQLLLTMASLPTPERLQVERVAAQQGVKLDSLYGVLRAMGTERMPESPDELQRVLEDQAARLREMTSQRAALATDDPEIAALAAAADRAIAEGAIQAARSFLDQAVARVEQDEPAVDELEELLKQKRIADAAVYAKRADAAALAFAFRDAAADYGKAHELVARWDDKLAWNYKNRQAEVLNSLGGATGDRAVLEEALNAYQAVLDMLPQGDRSADWARTRNNMAVVLNALGEREEGSDNLLRARAMFEETLPILAADGDDASWSAAQNNVGNILYIVGQRTGDHAMVQAAIEAYEAALAKRPRETVPKEWAATQGNIALATAILAEQRPDLASLDDAVAGYDAALEVLTRDRDAIEWAQVQNNRGNALLAIGKRRNDTSFYARAVEAYEASLSVRDRETWPLPHALTLMHLGNAYAAMGPHEWGTSSLEKARTSFETALTLLDRNRVPLDWAAAQNNLGIALQTLGQKAGDAALLKASAQAFLDAATAYPRDKLPLDWAMTQFNRGNTLKLLGALGGGELDTYRAAADAYRASLEEFTRERVPVQWATASAGLGDMLQSIANSEEGTASLEESIVLRRAALEVLTMDTDAVAWANAQNGLGTSLLNLSNRVQNGDRLPEARDAFEATTKVFTREAQPLQWAFAQNNIGDVHWSTGMFGGGVSELRLALERFETAKEVFSTFGFTPLAELVDNKIALVGENIEKAR
jgi:uncharacterized caspase-like protein/exonuclease VII small subunit